MKGRTNIELREQLTDSEGKKSLYNEDGTISAVGPITKVRDNGHKSNNFLKLFVADQGENGEKSTDEPTRPDAL